MKPRLLDLFCGAGDAAMGYHRAGFEVIGVDIEFQKHYPFEFHQADAMTYPLEGFDAIHASPPCQGYSVANNRHKIIYPKLIGDVRERLKIHGALYIIENVPNSPINASVMLCGTMFGFRFVMHRYFEISFKLSALIAPCAHRGSVKNGELANLYDNKHSPQMSARKINEVKETTWIKGKKQRRNAIPPAYTEFIGKQLMEALELRR